MKSRWATLLFAIFTLSEPSVAGADVLQDQKIFRLVSTMEKSLLTAMLMRDVFEVDSVENSLVDVINETNSTKKIGVPGSICHSASVSLFLNASFYKAAIERKGPIIRIIRHSLLR